MMTNFLKNESGNFGIMTALLIPTLLGAGGLAIDFSTAVLAKGHLQDIADSAAISAASRLARNEISIAAAKLETAAFAKAQFAQLNMATANEDFDVIIKQKTRLNGQKVYDVSLTLSATVPTTLARILGHKEIAISVDSDTNSETSIQPSLSVYLVLDRSGSMEASVTTSVDSSRASCDYFFLNAQQTAMSRVKNYKPCYFQRIEVMKTAVGDLMDSLAKEDPDEKFIRTGATAYSSSKFPSQELGWKPSAVKNHVNAMSPLGGTSSTSAFKEAVDSLLALTEDTVHLTKNGSLPKKFILFMTDGENNAASDNNATLTQCSKAKTAGVTVYTVGFMLSSTTAKKFLETCASNPSTYFDATDGEKLADAFAKFAQATKAASPRVTK
jgi:Flp pilus assembly protein TadG